MTSGCRRRKGRCAHTQGWWAVMQHPNTVASASELVLQSAGSEADSSISCQPGDHEARLVFSTALTSESAASDARWMRSRSSFWLICAPPSTGSVPRRQRRRFVLLDRAHRCVLLAKSSCSSGSSPGSHSRRWQRRRPVMGKPIVTAKRRACKCQGRRGLRRSRRRWTRRGLVFWRSVSSWYVLRYVRWSRRRRIGCVSCCSHSILTATARWTALNSKGRAQAFGGAPGRGGRRCRCDVCIF